jgi:molybdate transport repressor ModE-like protein/molybdopterin-binding protein
VTRRASRVTDLDIALLRSIGRERSVVAACDRVGVSHDVAVYRLRRLAHAFGGPVVASARGGRGHGGTTLTALGDRVARLGFDSVEMLESRPLAPLSRPNLLHGVYHAAPVPEVAVGTTLRLRVAFSAAEGERVTLLLDPEAVLVALRRFPSSARNVFPARVEAVRRERGSTGVTVVVRAGAVRLRVAMTEEPVRELGLVPGTPVVLYVKATAFRRIAERGGA